MNRKVILISGAGGTAFGKKEVSTFVNKLSQIEGIELTIVGNGEESIYIDDIIKSLDNIPQEQEVTIIIQSHGEMKGGFYFSLADDSTVSSKQLFQLIRNKLGEKSIDVFTQACHGGGMLLDKEELPEGSTLVSLTSIEEPNIGIAYGRMIDQFESLCGELTAYNILDFYLSNFLNSRSKPCIAISGQPTIYDLDAFLKTSQAKQIIFDNEHFSKLGETPRYLEVYKKMQNMKSEWDIFAVDYGLAMDICLNDLKNKGLVNNKNQTFDNRVR